MSIQQSGITRRKWLALAGFSALPIGAAARSSDWTFRRLATHGALGQIRAAEGGGLLAIGSDGTLWSYETLGNPIELADGIDPLTPLVAGAGRIAARTRDGGLWVHAGGETRTRQAMHLAPHAGLAMLPFAILAVVIDGRDFRLVRLEPASEGWSESARSGEAMMPDARPLLAPLGKALATDDPGDVVILAGPDEQRYDHGILGDRIEATRMLWLDRHSLRTSRELTLPAPYVFEDVAPRVVEVAGRTALLTMRSGGSGTRLALVDADPVDVRRLRLAALGEPLDGPHRWMAPTTDGLRLMAVHTPHVGGVLHAYRLEGDHLSSSIVATGVANHRIGTREVDLAIWRGSALIVPSQDGLRLRVFDIAERGAEQPAIELPSRVTMTAALADPSRFAVLMEDGTAAIVERAH